MKALYLRKIGQKHIFYSFYHEISFSVAEIPRKERGLKHKEMKLEQANVLDFSLKTELLTKSVIKLGVNSFSFDQLINSLFHLQVHVPLLTLITCHFEGSCMTLELAPEFHWQLYMCVIKTTNRHNVGVPNRWLRWRVNLLGFVFLLRSLCWLAYSENDLGDLMLFQ